MKKFIPMVLICLFIILLIEHYLGDDLYWFIKYGNQSVIEVNDNEYIVPKDATDNFCLYMEQHNWEKKETMGTVVSFQNHNSEVIKYRLYFYKYYAIWNKIS